MGAYRVTPRPQVRIPAQPLPDMSFVDMPNYFPGAQPVGKYHKQVFENHENLKSENQPNQ